MLKLYKEEIMQKKIVEYDIVSGFNIDSLSKEVNRKIDMGYQPFENIIIDSNKTVYYQAVVKYKSIEGN